MKKSLRIATICGALPLLFGVAIFVGWLVLRRAWLAIAGLMLLPIGLALVAAGAIALFWYWWLVRRDPDTPFAHRSTAVILIAGLFLANFAVAAAIVFAVAAIEGRYTVIVRNSSSVPLNDVRAASGRCDVSFGSIQPGATVRRVFPTEMDADLTFRASMDGRPLEGYIHHYEHVGRYAAVTVDQKRKVSVDTRMAHQLTMGERFRDVTYWLDHVPCPK